MIFAVIVLGIAVIALLVVLLTRKPASSGESALLIKEDLTQLTQNVTQLREGLQKQITDRLDENQAIMRKSMVDQFSASSKLITEVTEKLVKLDETNKRVVDVAVELKTLQNVLQNPKQRGVLGEYYLETLLQNVMPPGGFHLQHRFKDGDYNRLVEEKDQSKKEALVKLFKQDLKNRIDETAKYIRPSEGTMDFAFMFIPSEAIYYELLINKVGSTGTNARDLIDYAFRNKSVIIVSPTSFLAYLQTVLQGLRSLQIEEQAKDITVRVGELGKHLKAYDTFMQKLGSSLGTTVGHFNRAHHELKKVDKDVVKITGSKAAIEPLIVDKPDEDSKLED
jgi:DNA recombination protein RmuC